MNPNCSCVRGRCDVHKYVLKGKILERYLRDPAFADKVDHYDHDKKNKQRMARLGKQRDFANEIADLALISPKRGLGDRVEQALSMIGITKERVENWVGEECGCTERQEKLNQLGSWAHEVVMNGVQNAQSYLEKFEKLIGMK